MDRALQGINGTEPSGGGTEIIDAASPSLVAVLGTGMDDTAGFRVEGTPHDRAVGFDPTTAQPSEGEQQPVDS